MSTPAAVASQAPSDPTTSWAKARSKFFLYVAAAMFLTVFGGFSRTFYLRSIFGTRDMLGGQSLPWHLHVHGVAMSAWIALVLIQTVLIQAGRPRLHRRLGYIGLAVAGAMVITAAFTLAAFVPRASAASFTPDQVNGIVMGDALSMFVVFPALVGAGVWFRSRPDIHKRLMLLSCVLLFPPVASRYVATFLMNGWPPWPAILLGPIPFVWLLALVAHDLITRKRPHVVTVLGILTLFALGGATGLLVSTGIAGTFAAWLGQLNA
jgi:hypothetical protein